MGSQDRGTGKGSKKMESVHECKKEKPSKTNATRKANRLGFSETTAVQMDFCILF